MKKFVQEFSSKINNSLVNLNSYSSRHFYIKFLHEFIHIYFLELLKKEHKYLILFQE